MSLPAGLTLITITGQYTDASGTAQAGSVSFTPTSTVVDAAGKVVLTETAVTAILDSSGSFSLTLPCTGQSLVPLSWAYTLSVSVPGASGTLTPIYLPSALGSTVDISALTESFAAPAPSGVSYYPDASSPPAAGPSGGGGFLYADDGSLFWINPGNIVTQIAPNAAQGGGAATPTGAAGGDLGGTYPDPTVTGLHVTTVSPSGLTGATAATRYVGATTSGHPATGTFAVGDFAVDQTGTIWICTAAGSPGTWVGLDSLALAQTITGTKTFTATGSSSGVHDYGSVITHGITVEGNLGVAAGNPLVAMDDGTQVWEFFVSAVNHKWGVWDNNNSRVVLTAGTDGSLASLNSTLDDGSGNMLVDGSVATPRNTLDDGFGNATISGALGMFGTLDMESQTITGAQSVSAGQYLSSLAGGGSISQGSGAPSKPNGVNPTAGDYYFRTDTPSTSNQRIYVCTTGGASPVWSGIV